MMIATCAHCGRDFAFDPGTCGPHEVFTFADADAGDGTRKYDYLPACTHCKKIQLVTVTTRGKP